ncbi:MAG: CPBP family intramembrane glutamic endopeptidase [bacterium]
MTPLSETLLVIFNIACFSLFGVAVFETLRLDAASRESLFRRTFQWLVPFVVLLIVVIFSAIAVSPPESRIKWIAQITAIFFDAAAIFFFAVAGQVFYRRAQDEETFLQPEEESGISRGRRIAETLGLIALCQVISVVLFRIFPTKTTHLFSDVFPLQDLPPLIGVTLLMAILAKAAVFEEVMFRLFLFSGLILWAGERRGRFALAFVFPAILWAMGHAGVFEEDFVKLLQIFLIGLLLSATYLRLGFRACLWVHIGFNLTLPITAQLFFRFE